MNNPNGLDVLSMFDGMACGRIALDRAHLPVNSYRAYEIDKWAIQIAKKNYPAIVEQGDVQYWMMYEQHNVTPDIILAGSPCQGFSVSAEARAQGFEDPRSKLFFTFVKVLEYWKQRNPYVKFLLENVKMKKEWRDQITKILGVEPILLNSELVSAQSRPRYYWANFPIDPPVDRHIGLQSILDNGTAVREKGYCIDANYFKGGRPVPVVKDREQGIHVDFRHQQRQRRAMVCVGDPQDPYNGYRCLTPREVERMQTVPEDYTAGVSNTQRYHMLGNGWTVDMIAHILSQMPRRA